MRWVLPAVAAFCVLLLLPVRGADAQPEPQSPSPQDPSEPRQELGDEEQPPPSDSPVVDEPTSAKVRTRQLSRGLFGDRSRDHQGLEGLDVRVTAFGAYDDNLSADASGGSIDPLSVKGRYTNVSTSVDYYGRVRRASITAKGSSATSYFHDHAFDDSFVSSQGAGVGLSVPLDELSSLGMHETISYSPFYRFASLPVPPPLFASDVTVTAQTRNFDVGNFGVFRHSTSVELSRRISRRASISAFYDLNATDLSKEFVDLREQRVGGRLTRSLSRYGGVELGYALRKGRYALQAESPSLVTHDVSAGFNYARPLSFSRRTTFHLTTGSSLIMPSETAAAASTEEDKLHAELTGVVSLDHEMGRTWNAVLSVRREVQFVEGFVEPLVATETAARLGGYLTRRVAITLDALYSRGVVGVTTYGNQFDTTALSAQLRIALTRRLAVFAEPLYYQYHFGSAVALPSGVPPSLERRGMRFGLLTYFPVK